MKNINNKFSLEEQLELVKEHGWNITFIKTPSLKIQQLAIQRDPTSIKYIKNPSQEMIELAQLVGL